jgi:hypothetical protein
MEFTRAVCEMPCGFVSLSLLDARNPGRSRDGAGINRVKPQLIAEHGL